MVSFNDFMETNYDHLRGILVREWRQRSQTPFDEDLFHDTLINCMEKFPNTDEKSESDFIAYTVKAFRNNFCRKRLYHDVSKSVDAEVENFQIETKMKLEIDINIVLEYVKSQFGELQALQFADWINDQTIKQLNAKYNCTNARHVIDRIRVAVYEHFMNDLDD